MYVGSAAQQAMNPTHIVNEESPGKPTNENGRPGGIRTPITRIWSPVL
jgi:hypothetical protein